MHARTSAAPKVLFAVVQVHAAALALGNALLEAKQFRHNALHRVAADVTDAVAAVGRDDVIIGRQTGLETRSNGFLAVVKVKETADVAVLWQLINDCCLQEGIGGDRRG